MSQAPTHDGIAAGTLYNDTARQLVLFFKHGRKIALAPMLARLIAARLPDLDVLTSGATSSACVAALKQAGAKKVVIACFSRVLGSAH